jgi:hypothetical protein
MIAELKELQAFARINPILLGRSRKDLLESR